MDHLAKPLFHTDRVRKTVRSTQLRRRPIRKANARPGLSGILCMLLLLVIALSTILLMRGDCTFWEDGDTKWSINEKTKEELWRFFSNQPLTNMSASPAWLDFHGKHVLGWFGALQISILAGLIFGLCTYLCMYYDSSEPGSFPPSPISPRQSRDTYVSKEYALGYRMVPVNVLIFVFIFIILLRFYLNLPFY